MRAKTINVWLLASAIGLGGLTAGCAEMIREDRSPVTLVINSLLAASGAGGSTGTFTGTLNSDVVTVVDNVPGIYNDSGRVTLQANMKDVLTTPSAVNSVTINRYRVNFRRSDGRNTPGVDVPYPFDSALTVTVPAGGTASASFELIRHSAKQEAPLAALAISPVIISTVADVTFFGRDQAGNELSVMGSIGVQFGNFGDPTN